MIPVNTDPSLRSRQIPWKLPIRFLLDLTLHPLIQSRNPSHKPNQILHANPSSVKFNLYPHSTTSPKKHLPISPPISQPSHLPQPEVRFLSCLLSDFAGC